MHLLLGSSATWPSSKTLTIEDHWSLLEGMWRARGNKKVQEVPDGSGGLLKAQGVDMRSVWLAGRVAKKKRNGREK